MNSLDFVANHLRVSLLDDISERTLVVNGVCHLPNFTTAFVNNNFGQNLIFQSEALKKRGCSTVMLTP